MANYNLNRRSKAKKKYRALLAAKTNTLKNLAPRIYNAWIEQTRETKSIFDAITGLTFEVRTYHPFKSIETEIDCTMAKGHHAPDNVPVIGSL